MIAPGRPPANVVPCTMWHLLYLCERMRADEIAQYEALTGRTFQPETAALGFANMTGHKFTVLGPDNLPAAAGGYDEVSQGVWQSWMVGTEDGWRTSWRALTKATRWLMEGILASGARRLQTTGLASRTKALEWYTRGLGLQREGTMRAVGVHGEDVAMFARVRED